MAAVLWVCALCERVVPGAKRPANAVVPAREGVAYCSERDTERELLVLVAVDKVPGMLVRHVRPRDTRYRVAGLARESKVD